MTIRYALDLSRLFTGSLRQTPRGIDRVEMEYAAHFFAPGRNDTVGVLPTPWGTRIFDADAVRRMIAALERLWSETTDIAHDTAWKKLKQRLDGAHVAERNEPRHGVPFSLRRPARMARLAWALRSPGRSAVRALPQGCFYINVGQVRLAIAALQTWLDRRPDLRTIVMLHDVIPVTTPEFVSRREAMMHATMVDQTSKRASALIATSIAARTEVLAELGKRGGADIPVVTLPLPVPSIFTDHVSQPEDHALLANPYFAICGSIEARKNQMLLLNIWTEMASEIGDAAPRLVVAGSPGWGGRQILHMLNQNRRLKDKVILARGLSSPAIIQVMAGARAVLMPSFAEGYGLPVLEALALGTPVIASDIPSHIEIAGDDAVLLDPNDGPAWKQEILRLAAQDASLIARRKRAASWTWRDYFAGLESFLKTLARKPE